jgi:hypothetical protein
MGTTFSTFALLSFLLEGQVGKSQIVGLKLPVLVANLWQSISGMVPWSRVSFVSYKRLWTRPSLLALLS